MGIKNNMDSVKKIKFMNQEADLLRGEKVIPRKDWVRKKKISDELIPSSPSSPSSSLVKYLPADWKDKVLNWFCQGWSKKEILRELCLENPEKKFSIWTWRNIEKRDKEFMEIISIGLIMSCGWWERKGRICLDVRDFNANLWLMNMRNRFGWREPAEDERPSDNSTHYHLHKLDDKEIIEKLRSQGCNLPVGIESRIG